MIYKDENTTYHLKFSLGDTVFIKKDTEQREMMVVGVLIQPSGISYTLGDGDCYSTLWEMEISKEKDVLKSL